MKRLIFFLSILPLFAGCAATEQETPKKDEKSTETAERVSTEYRERYDSGQLKIEGTLVNEKRHGLWKSYYPDGKKWSETTFVDGVKTGPTTTFFENGMMRYTGHYENDQKVGVWNLYNPDGVLERTLNLDEEPETEKHIQEHSSR